jgi:DNA polymerase-3 subunit gamma/tau
MTGIRASKFESLAISGPNRLVVRFRQSYIGFKEHCEKPEARTRLEEALAQVAGRVLRIDFEVVPDPLQPAAPERVQKTAPAVNRRQRNADASRVPLIRQAIELFDAEVTDVRDPAPKPDADDDLPPSPPSGGE